MGCVQSQIQEPEENVTSRPVKAPPTTSPLASSAPAPADSLHNAAALAAMAAATDVNNANGVGIEPNSSMKSPRDVTNLPEYSANCTSNLLYDTQKFATEASRLQTLSMCNVLQTADEPRFDAITSLAASMFGAPCSVISLVHDNMVYAKSGKGAFARQAEREGSICTYIMVPDHAQCLIIEDCSQDARASVNPYVAGPPFIRFYAGAPLVASETGLRLGTICIIDFQPRPHLSPALYNVLCNLSELTVRELERDRAFEAHSCSAADVGMNNRDAPKALQESVIVIDTGDETWPILYANSPWCNMFDTDVDDILQESLWEHFEALPGTAIRSIRAELDGGKQSVRLKLKLQEDDKMLSCGDATAVVTVDFRLAGRDQLANSAPISIPGFISTTASQEYDKTDLEAAVNAIADGSADGVAVAEAEGQSLAPAATSAAAEDRAPLAEDILIGVVTINTSSSTRSSDNRRESLDGIRLSGGGSNNAGRARSFDGASSAGSMTLNRHRKMSGLQLGPLLGVGSYGKVYRGMLGSKEVAVKVLELFEPTSGRGGANGGAAQAQEVLKEALLSRHLVHPNVVPTFDFLMVDDDISARRSSLSSYNNGHAQQQAKKTSKGTTGGGTTTSLGGFSSGSGSIGMDYESEFAILNDGPQYPTRAGYSSCPTHSVWIVQHYCDRGSLYDALDMGAFRQANSMHAPPCLPTVIATALDIASGMQYLHEENVLHGDLSGNNVLLTASHHDKRGFTAMVSDFGLSRAAPGTHGGAMTKTVGTITHQPPETLEQGIVSKEGDVYAFGVILWEMYSGRRAWAGCHMAQIVFFVTVQRRKLELAEDAPQELKDLLAACLSADPENRPSFADIKVQLEDMMKRMTE